MYALMVCLHSINTYVLCVLVCCTMAQQVMDKAVRENQICFPCVVNGEGSCLDWKFRCDGEKQCDDDTDESFETCYGDSCVASLPSFRRCDGKKDCRDGRDEYYDGCHEDEKTETAGTVFGNMSVAVAIMFLGGVVVILLGLVFCICCCCRRGRERRRYDSNTFASKKIGTVNGYRFVAHAYPLSMNYAEVDGNALYDVQGGVVQLNNKE